VTFVGSSGAAANVRSQLDRVAPTGSRVMITGPSGAGKETVARLIHQGSKRADGPFVIVNCSAMPAERLELELFGTDGESGPDALRVSGAFEMAHGGTLLLKEVADLPVPLQSRLARVLQEQSFTRDGGTTKVEVDVRVLASTARTLQDEIASGGFREELFHRLNVVALRVPPLSERREDIPEVAHDLLQRVADATGLPARPIGEDTLAALQGHDWPGNVRQLRNVIERLLILAPSGGGPIRADALPNDVSEDAPSVLRWEKGGEIMQLPLRDAREVFEREYLLAQVTRLAATYRAPRPSWHGALGAASQIEVARPAWRRCREWRRGRDRDPRSVREWRVMPTSMDAMSITAKRACTSRIAAISWPTASTRWSVCATASSSTRSCTSTGSAARWASCASPGRWRGRPWASSCAS
jgi:DNA-binding NtrC family response regulator